MKFLTILYYALNNRQAAMLIIGFLYEFGLIQGRINYKNAAIWYYLAIHQNNYNHLSMIRGLQNFNQGKYKLAALWFRMAAELSLY